MLFMRAKLINIFPTKGGKNTDKETGEVKTTLPGHKAQIQTVDYVADKGKNDKGEEIDILCPKIVMRDLNIKQAFNTWKPHIGKTVEFAVAIYKDAAGNPQFYLPPKYNVTPVSDDKA